MFLHKVKVSFSNERGLNFIAYSLDHIFTVSSLTSVSDLVFGTLYSSGQSSAFEKVFKSDIYNSAFRMKKTE